MKQKLLFAAYFISLSCTVIVVGLVAVRYGVNYAFSPGALKLLFGISTSQGEVAQIGFMKSAAILTILTLPSFIFAIIGFSIYKIFSKLIR